MLRFQAALRGDLKKIMTGEVKAAEDAVTAAMKIAGDGLKTELRAQITGAGMGARLANTWRSRVYPTGRRSISAAALVFSKAPKLIDAFNRGALIKSPRGFWLAIPTKNAPKRGVGGKRISPSTWPTAAYGPLRFVPAVRGIGRAGKEALLVVDGLRARTGKRGGYAKASQKARSAGHTATVVMFILVPQARLRKRLDIEGAALRWQLRLDELIVQNWRS